MLGLRLFVFTCNVKIMIFDNSFEKTHNRYILKGVDIIV